MRLAASEEMSDAQRTRLRKAFSIDEEYYQQVEESDQLIMAGKKVSVSLSGPYCMAASLAR